MKFGRNIRGGLLRYLRESTFVRNSFVTVAGAGISQAVILAASPILTRLYSPASFGEFSFLFAVIGLTSSLASLRYSMAIVMPRSDRSAGFLLLLSGIITLAISLLLLLPALLLYFFWPAAIDAVSVDFARQPILILMVPLGFALTGFFELQNYYCIRKTEFSRIAKARVWQAVFTVILSILLAYFLKGRSIGLITGSLVGLLIGNLVLLKAVRTNAGSIRPDKHGRLRVLSLARKYADFPKFTLLAAFVSGAYSNGFKIIFGTLFGGIELGAIAIAQRVLRAPVILIGGSIQKVVVQKVTSERQRNNSPAPVILVTAGILLALSTPPALAIALWGEEIFIFIFGPEWARAGVYASILAPLLAIELTVSSVSKFYLFDKQRVALVWETVRAVGAITALVIGHLYDSVEKGIILYVWFSIFMYLVHLALTIKFASEIGRRSKSS